jgi:hypothetical protein
MAVLILRQQGPNALPEKVVTEVENHPHLQVLDRSSKMLRVEGEGHDLQVIADQHPGLHVSEERSYHQVDPVHVPLRKKDDPKT